MAHGALYSSVDSFSDTYCSVCFFVDGTKLEMGHWVLLCLGLPPCAVLFTCEAVTTMVSLQHRSSMMLLPWTQHTMDCNSETVSQVNHFFLQVVSVGQVFPAMGKVTNI